MEAVAHVFDNNVFDNTDTKTEGEEIGPLWLKIAAQMV